MQVTIDCIYKYDLHMKTILSFLIFSVFTLSHEVSGTVDPYQYFDSNGVKIAYRVFGTGSPLFLLNGGPGRSSDTFADLAESLQKKTNRQVIIFDQRGTGRSVVSPLDETTISLDLMVEDFEALRKHLGFNKISILGHSFGGMYAMSYAVRYSANVESIVLSCSAGVDLTWKEYVQENILSRLSKEAREQYEYWTSPAQEAADLAKAQIEALKLIAPVYVYNQKFVPQIVSSLSNYNTPGLNSLVWKTMKNYDLKLPLKQLHVPVLIIDGRQDFLGEAVPIAIHQTIPNSRLEFLNECSHYPWLDTPVKYFELIADFLK